MHSHNAVQKKTKPRQDPVSCQLCRSKKLKCNRQRPCSNCISRDVPCIGPYHEPAPESRASDSGAILARLERLENIVLKSRKTSALPEVESLEFPCSSAKASATPPETKLTIREDSRKADQRWLGNLGSVSSSKLGVLSDGLTWRICTMPEIVQAASYFNLQTGHLSADDSIARFTWLPSRDLMIRLFEEYCTLIGYYNCVVHRPTFLRQIDSLYENLTCNLQPTISHLALALSVIATAAYIAPLSNQTREVFGTIQDALNVSILWGRNTFDVLEYVRRSEVRTLEEIQATIVMTLWVYNAEGFSSRGRLLNATALALSREFGLHKIDFQNSNENLSFAETEIRRRVWWHIASSDWLLALHGSAQEGTYWINPKHMKVRYPLNVTDEELDNCQGQIQSRSLSEPTPTSFFIQRIRLAELCRVVADHLPLSISDPEDCDYREIISLDGKFEQFILELPGYLRFDEKSVRSTQGTYKETPQILFQRYMVHFGVLTKRCKLHQPFLIRNSMDTRYGYSRDICLRSARQVIKLREMLSHESAAIASIHLRFGFITYHVFLAVVVLVMDVCFNRDETPREEQKAEIEAALKLLEISEEPSKMTRNLLDGLMGILRKYQIILFNVESSTATSDLTSTTNSESLPESWANNSVPASNSASSPFIDDIWQTYVGLEPSSNVMDWDKLFSEIDAQGI